MKKLKVLIISFYFPPCNGTPSPRVHSWAKAFTEANYEVSVASRHWSEEKSNWKEYVESTSISKSYVERKEGYNILWLPFKKFEYGKRKLTRKFKTLYHLIKGNLEREADSMQFFPELKSLCDREQFDLIISTAPPWNVAKLTYELHKSTKIPYAVDFRDYENDVVLNQAFKPSFSRKLEFYLNRLHILKWISKSKLIVSASKPIGDYLSKRTRIPNVEILNGYEKDLIENVAPKETNKFTVSVLGFLFAWQDISIIIKGLQKFLKNKKSNNIELNFVGQKGIPTVANTIRESIDNNFINLTDRVSPEEAISIGKSSDVLLYAGWKNWSGVYSAKIFTYLGLGKNILIAPGDEDVIDDLITETKSGKIVNSVDAFAKQMEHWYNEWETTGSLEYSADKNSILQYDRNNQAHKMIESLEKYYLN